MDPQENNFHNLYNFLLCLYFCVCLKGQLKYMRDRGCLVNLYLINMMNNSYYLWCIKSCLAIKIYIVELRLCNILTIFNRNAYHGASPSTLGLTNMGQYKFPTLQNFGCHSVSELNICPCENIQM